MENSDQVILPRLEAETFRVIGKHDNDYNKKSWQDQVKIFLIKLNWSITKKWKFVDLSLHTGRQFGHIFYGQNGRVVKAMDCKSIGLCTRGIESNLFRFFNWFYGEMDSNLQFE